MLPAIRESKTERERTEIKQRVDKKRVNAISTVTAACVAHPLLATFNLVRRISIL